MKSINQAMKILGQNNLNLSEAYYSNEKETRINKCIRRKKNAIIDVVIIKLMYWFKQNFFILKAGVLNSFILKTPSLLFPALRKTGFFFAFVFLIITIPSVSVIFYPDQKTRTKQIGPVYDASVMALKNDVKKNQTNVLNEKEVKK